MSSLYIYLGKLHRKRNLSDKHQVVLYSHSPLIDLKRAVQKAKYCSALKEKLYYVRPDEYCYSYASLACQVNVKVQQSEGTERYMAYGSIAAS